MDMNWSESKQLVSLLHVGTQNPRGGFLMIYCNVQGQNLSTGGNFLSISERIQNQAPELGTRSFLSILPTTKCVFLGTGLIVTRKPSTKTLPLQLGFLLLQRPSEHSIVRAPSIT